MYTRRVQLANYGPIEKLDIELPFEGENPKPVVLVGENGSGKSILLSHIVNGLIAAKGIAYPETPEVELGKAYKLRSGSYIKPGSEYYFGRVDFDGAFFISEIRSRRNKQEYPEVPTGILGTAAESMWEKVVPEENDHYDSNLIHDPSTTNKIKDVFAKNCVLYFPFNRFEEPAWLNEENLQAKAQYMDIKHLAGYTSRKVIASSPLHENQNWLFDVIYDRAAFELQTSQVNLPVNDGNATIPLPLFSGYSGDAAKTYETVLHIVRIIARREDARFGIGRRNNRVVSILSGTDQLVPNIFQLSSGETSLLNLFLSILRDFDLCGTPFSSATNIRGVVVVDEIDLHLHAIHQHEILPNLMRMFPKVQFVVTTHSPLFVLGMNKVFGEDGFALYRMPQGQRISPEEFSEFGDAYQSLTATRRFTDDVRTAIERSKKPIVLLEGITDQKYLQKASSLLEKEAILQGFEVQDGGGSGNLANIWKDFRHPLTDILPQKVLLLFDCDKQRANENKGNLFQRTVPLQADNPVKEGIENLFGKPTLHLAHQHNPAFIDIAGEHPRVERGERKVIPEQWTVNKDEKTNLCDWLCENGTQEDFESFQVIFELLEGLLDLHSEPSGKVALSEHVNSDGLPDEGGVANLEESQ